MAFSLGPVAASAGHRLESFATIGSTNSEALERFRSSDPGRLWIVSAAQTAGQGRRGRTWETPSGNLAASLLLPVNGPEARVATLGFVAGLALESAVQECAPGVVVRVALDATETECMRLRLKWPNDLLIDGAKAAGILMQTAAGPAGARAVVIGFGVNVAHAPTDVPYPATSLSACGADVTAQLLFASLSDFWVRQEAIWDHGRGFPNIRKLWLERAAGRGAPVAVKMGETVLRGTFETIDDDGMLILRDSAGMAQRIAAGDVHFGAAATVRQ